MNSTQRRRALDKAFTVEPVNTSPDRVACKITFAPLTGHEFVTGEYGAAMTEGDGILDNPRRWALVPLHRACKRANPLGRVAGDLRMNSTQRRLERLANLVDASDIRLAPVNTTVRLFGESHWCVWASDGEQHRAARLLRYWAKRVGEAEE